MARYKVIPTKTNLARLRRDLSFAREGYELLEQKRQILVVELMALMDKVADAQDQAERELKNGYQALQEAVLAMGRRNLAQITPAVNIQVDMTINVRRVMGVNIPKVDLSLTDHAPYFSPVSTSFWADETVFRFKHVLEALGKLAELRISLMRVAQEVQKTVRRVNALDKIAIPDFRESIKYIEDTLEESERGTFATLKIVKERLEKAKG
ncbi:V-type ATP synthase subunit D [bacterium]|nr:V-type ATP synthase subunit D [bacterium]